MTAWPASMMFDHEGRWRGLPLSPLPSHEPQPTPACDPHVIYRGVDRGWRDDMRPIWSFDVWCACGFGDEVGGWSFDTAVDKTAGVLEPHGGDRRLVLAEVDAVRHRAARGWELWEQAKAGAKARSAA